jgi:hypothetical protein
MTVRMMHVSAESPAVLPLGQGTTGDVPRVGGLHDLSSPPLRGIRLGGREHAAGRRQADQSRATAAEVPGSHQLQTGAHSRTRIEHGARNGLPVTCCICWGPGRTPFFNQFMTARSRLLR